MGEKNSFEGEKVIISEIVKMFDSIDKRNDDHLTSTSQTIQAFFGGSTSGSFLWYSIRGFERGVSKMGSGLCEELSRFKDEAETTDSLFRRIVDWLEAYKIDDEYYEMEYDKSSVAALHRFKTRLIKLFSKQSVAAIRNLRKKYSSTDYFRI